MQSFSTSKTSRIYGFKFYETSVLGRNHLSRQAITYWIMRVSVFYIIMFLSIPLLYASRLNGQGLEDTRVTIEMKGEKLGKLLDKLQQQTQLSFFYTESEVDRYTVTFPALDRTVAETLDLALKGTDLLYEINEKAIVLGLKTKIKKKKMYGEKEQVLNKGTIKTKSNETFMTVTGKVTDTDGIVMAGVNILVKRTTTGTTTDSEGNFAIEARESDYLIFSFIGYKKFETQVNGRTVIDIVLEEDISALQEVTVNAGYYTTTDKLKTGNISKVTAKEIANQPVTSPLLALQGRVAGLQITPQNGAPGSAPTIRIRGENSLRSDGGYPLYVIDGVIVDSRPIESSFGAYYQEGIDPLVNLNSEEIASIEILKDADATAIYGSRGANGVILITTKQGQEAQTNLEVSTYKGIGEISQRMNLLNTEQYLEMRREAFENDEQTPGSTDYDVNGIWDSTRYTNWQEKLTGGSAHITDFQANFSAGNKLTKFRLGAGYHKETSILPGDFGYNRFTGNFNFTHTSSNQKLNVLFSANYGATKNSMMSVSSFLSAALNLAPNAPKLFNEDGSLNWEIVQRGSSYRNTWENPYSQLLRTHETNSGTLVANSVIGFKVLPELNIKANLGYTESNGDQVIKRPIASRSPTSISSITTGQSYFGLNKRSSWIIEPQLSLNKKFGDHSMNLIFGTTFQESNSKWSMEEAQGYTSDVLLESREAATSFVYHNDDYSQYRYTAIFARIGYNWKDRYLVNLSGRRDGSSRFGPSKQFGNFGAIGVAWIFSNESFLTNFNIFSFGKLRGSYGATGNDQIGDYQFYNLYEINNYTYQNFTTLLPVGLFNDDFQWEVTKKIEASLELGFFKDKLSLQATWYQNRSSNQLIYYQLPVITGFNSIFRNIDATVENRGWEFVLNSQNVNSNNFKWKTSMNLTIPKNELVSFPDIEKSSYATKYKVGESLSVQRLYLWEGINPQTGNHEIADLNDDGEIDDEDKIFRDSFEPKYYGGLLNSFQYKTLEFSFLFQFSKQLGDGLWLNAPGVGFPTSNVGNQPIEVLKRWQSEGEITDIAKYSRSNTTSGFSDVRVSTYNVVDATFIKLKTVTLSYNLPSSLLDKLLVKEVRVYFQGQNLFTIADFLGLDPETGATTLPQLRMITGGILLKF